MDNRTGNQQIKRQQSFYTVSKQQKLAAQTLMATQDEDRPHQISLISRFVIESPRAKKLSQYLYVTETHDSAHIVHEVQMRHQGRDAMRTGSY